MSFVAYTIGEVDVNSPLHEIFFGKMKDNFDDLDSRATNHTHDGSASALPLGKAYASGDYVIINNPKERSNDVTGSYSTMKEIVVKKAGVIQCQWEVKDTGGGTVRTQIFVDNVLADAGENTTSSSTYVTKSLADITVQADDIIELRGKPDVSMDVRNFEIAVSSATVFSEGYHKDR